MFPGLLSHCSSLLIAGAVVIGATGGSLAVETSHYDAQTACTVNFAPGNRELSLTNRRARTLVNVCRQGVAAAETQLPKVLDEAGEGVSRLSLLRAANRQALNTCNTNFDDRSKLQERMACLDGVDYLSGAAAIENGALQREKPAVEFDRAYYVRHTYQDVYQDFGNADWAYVVADRLANPKNYPAVRRDALYAPDMPDDQAGQALAFSQQHGELNPSSSSWLWWWHFSHYQNCFNCGGYVPITSFNSAAYPSSARRGTEVGAGAAPPSPPNFYGPRAYDPPVTKPTSVNPSAVNPPSSNTIVRGGLGAYGGYASRPEGTQTPTFNAYSGSASATTPGSGPEANGHVTVTPAPNYGRTVTPPSEPHVGGSPPTPAAITPRASSSPSPSPSTVTARPSPTYSAPARASSVSSSSSSAGG